MKSSIHFAHILRLAVDAALALALNASAQSTWTNSAGGNWSVAANWTGGVPVSGGTTILNFTAAGAYNVTNDLPGVFQLNQINFAGPTLSLRGNNLQLTGDNPQVNQNGAGPVTNYISIELTTNVTLGGVGGGTMTFAGVLTGSGSLTKTNGGTLTIPVAHGHSGGTIILNGTLNPHGNGSGASLNYFGTGTLTLTNGVTLRPTDVSGQPVRFANAVTLSGGTVNVPIPFGGGTDLRLDGVVSGPGGFSISGGTRGLSLFSSNTFSGGVTLNDGNRVHIVTVNGLGTGSLRLGNSSGGSLNPSANLSGGLVTNTINLAAGGTLSVDTGGGSVNLAGSITNTGALTKNGANTLVLSGVNTHSGNTTVNAGSLTLSNSLALQNSTFVFGANGTLAFGGSLTPFTLGGISGVVAVPLVNAVGAPVVLTVGNNNASTTYSGTFSGAGGLTKSGAGTLTLGGTNTFSGVTTISGGVLRLTNSAVALSANTDVVLNNGSGALHLGFIGTNVVNALFINGTKQPIGDYGANGSTLTGSGFLRVATAALSSRKDILTLTFPTFGAATVAGTNITLTVPFNTPVTNLAPTFTLSLLATASPVSGTPRDFTTPQVYTVTAEDGSTRGYRVTVIVTPASAAKDILAMTFPSYGAATIVGTNITMTVPYGTAVTNLAPTFTVSPAATASPVSGTARDFTTPQLYTVTAENGSTRVFRVTVNITPISSAKDILTFDFGGLGPATIAGTNITITVGLNVGLTNLAPTFTVSPFAGGNPASGTTNDFTTPRTYTVTAQDGSTKGYLVTVQTYLSWLYSGSFHIITTSEGANLPGSASETNFPLLVRLNASFFNFSQAKAGGADIRFTTSAGATLAYQIEEWDAANGTASIWVRVPEIRGNARQQLVMYWGKADATSQSSGPAVFNGTNGFLSVFHMNEALVDAVGTLTPTDTGTLVTTGMVGKARRFAAGTGINCGESITNFPTGTAAHSTEAWFRANAVNADIVDWGTEGGGNKVQIKLVSPPRIHVEGNFANVGGISPLALGQWYHVVHTYTNGSSRVYIDGRPDGTNSVTLTMANPARMWIGGWYNNYTFVGEIDEVRVSKVARSANWIKLQYENQKPLQTLVGNLVQPGTNFSVAPAQVTMNEGASTNLTAEAGGAQKIYWISKRNGQETVLAVDQFTLNLAAGRVTGDQSFVIQFKAVYPTDIKTNDIPVTITEVIPDPEFALNASTNLWDGRQTMTVTPNISNWSALLEKGATNLTYTWTVSSVAVIKQIAGGTLTLLRAQGSGPMTVRLVLNNGGALITNTTTIPVQEPATDAWVHRTPATNEVPVHGQFYARDDTGLGTLHYNGTLGGSPSSVFLRVFTNGPSGDVLYTNLSQSLAGGAYAFAARLAPGLITYSVQFGSVTAGVTNVLNTVTNLICGDAYVIHGQSNAEATAPGTEAVPYTNRWIRSYNGGWNNAIRAGNNWHIGYWGMDLATNLLTKYQVPICIINGGVGGTRIDQHQPNPTNHFDTSARHSLYGNFLVNVAGAKLTHGIRAVLWHQGEQDQGSEGPTGDFNWKSYQQFFVDLSAAWKQDFPNLRYYYVYQIWPAACGDTSANDMLREVQRTLPSLYSNMRLMTTVGIVPGSSCHYVPAGYARFAQLMSPLLEKDRYGLIPSAPITAPDVKRVWFTTTNRNEIALEFGQDMAWNNLSKNLFFLDGVAGKVASGSVSGKVIKLQLTSASTNETITYLKGIGWDGVQANILYGSNGIAALTFAAVRIEPPVSGSLTNTTATGITTTSAVLRATLSAPAGAFAVHAFWNTVNAGTNASLWTNSASVGAWTNIAATNLSYTATGLTPGTPYHFTFRATNTTEVLWATNVLTFTTLALPPAPVLAGGAVTMAGGVPTFNFPTVAGYKYRLVYMNALTDATWQPVIAPPDFPSPDGWSATSTGTAMIITDSGVAGMGQRFYRLESAYP
jgi:autotransporter-associated beta strand protein